MTDLRSARSSVRVLRSTLDEEVDLSVTITDPLGLDDDVSARFVQPPLPTWDLEGTLGCGKINIYLTTRTGPTEVLYDLTPDLISGCTFSRVLNDTSSATIRVKECYTGFGIQPWYHSILIAWDATYVWYGPVTSVVDANDGTVTIQAKDISTWLSHWLLLDDYDSTGAPVDGSAFFATVVSEVFDFDGTVPYVISAAVTGINVERKFMAEEFIYARDVVDEVTTTGCDWTVFLNEIVCGNVEGTVVVDFSLTIEDMKTKPSVTLAGDDAANIVYIVGEGDVFALDDSSASRILRGNLMFAERQPDIRDNPSAAARALSVLQFRHESPVLIEGIQLKPSAAVQVNDLVPGIEFDVQIPGSVVPFTGTVRLQSVDFTDEDDTGTWDVTLHCNTIGDPPED